MSLFLTDLQLAVAFIIHTFVYTFLQQLLIAHLLFILRTRDRAINKMNKNAFYFFILLGFLAPPQLCQSLNNFSNPASFLLNKVFLGSWPLS